MDLHTMLTKRVRARPSFVFHALAVSAFGTALLDTASAQTNTTPFVQLGELGGAYIQRIAIDPQDSAALYVDTSGGRIARSFSGGVRWDTVQVGALNEYFRAIAVHPLRSNVVFAFSASDDGLSAGGFYLSADRGGHWTRTAAQPVGDFGPAGDGRGMAVDERGRVIVIADLIEGIFRSTDLGQSWTNTLSGSEADLYGVVQDPDDPRTFWTVGNDANGANGAWVSRDFGRTWSESVIPSLGPTISTTPTAVAVQPGTGKVLVGLNSYDLATGLPYGRFASSTDGGHSWSVSDPGVAEWNAGRAIVFDPAAPMTVLTGSNGFAGALRSTDGGASWTAVSPRGGAEILTLTAWPADLHAYGRVAGSTFQLFTSGDFGATWSGPNPSLYAAGAQSIIDDPQLPHGLYGLSGTGELARSVDGGVHWIDIAPGGIRSVSAVVVETASLAHAVFAASASGSTLNAIWRSLDSGLHWTALPGFPATAGVVTLLADPLKPGRIYALCVVQGQGYPTVLLRTDDFGEHWSTFPISVTGDFPSELSNQMVIDPSRPGTLYAALFSGLWKSKDSGMIWHSVGSLPLGDFGIVGLAATAGPGGGLFVVTAASDGSFTLQKSTDGAATWTPASNASLQLPYQIASAPDGRLFAYPNSYPYGCYDNEVQMSRDGGQTWSSIGASTVLAQMVYGNCPAVMPTADHIYLSDFVGNQRIYGAQYRDIDELLAASPASMAEHVVPRLRASNPATMPQRRVMQRASPPLIDLRP
jgi:hypothetical protein